LWVVDVDVWFGFRHVLIDGGEDGLGSLTSSLDLQESMRMIKLLFALLAVVEVLADTAFVTNSDDGVGTAAVTDDV